MTYEMRKRRRQARKENDEPPAIQERPSAPRRMSQPLFWRMLAVMIVLAFGAYVLLAR